MGVIVVLAAGGVTAYLVTTHEGAGHGHAPLPTRVVSSQTVGLIAQNAEPNSAGELLQLRGPASGPQFGPVSPAQEQSGSGQWTADLMAGNTYIFIFLPDGNCLGAVGPAGARSLALRHCTLAASQRWRRVGPAVRADGHDFYRYANVGDGSCLTETAELPGPVWGAGLAACSSSASANQLIAFWWAPA